jgi:hypothetical protein
MKELVFGAFVFLTFLGMMVFAGIYNDTLRMECREQAMEKPYTSAEIQVICK